MARDGETVGTSSFLVDGTSEGEVVKVERHNDEYDDISPEL